jgi:hypothetical protein
VGQAAFVDYVSPEVALLFSTENERSTDMPSDEAAKAADATATAEETQIAEKVAEAAASSTEPVADPAKPVGAEILKEFQSYVGSERGKIAQEFGQRGVALEKTILANIDARLAPLTQEMAQFRKARLAEMEPETRADYLQAENDELRTGRANDVEYEPAAESAKATDYSAAFGVVAGIARGLSLAVDITGNTDVEQAKKVWAGWREGMTQEEIVAVADRNLRAMVTAAAPAAPVKPVASTPAKPPPSTKSAGSTPQDSYDTPADLAEAVVKGLVNSTESRKIRRGKTESGEWM